MQKRIRFYWEIVMSIIWILIVIIVIGYCMIIGFFGAWRICDLFGLIILENSQNSEIAHFILISGKWIGALIGAPSIMFLGAYWLKKMKLFNKAFPKSQYLDKRNT